MLSRRYFFVEPLRSSSVLSKRSQLFCDLQNPMIHHMDLVKDGRRFSISSRVPVIAGPSGYDSLLGMEVLEGCRIDLDGVLGEVRIGQL